MTLVMGANDKTLATWSSGITMQTLNPSDNLDEKKKWDGEEDEEEEKEEEGKEEREKKNQNSVSLNLTCEALLADRQP